MRSDLHSAAVSFYKYTIIISEVQRKFEWTSENANKSYTVCCKYISRTAEALQPGLTDTCHCISCVSRNCSIILAYTKCSMSRRFDEFASTSLTKKSHKVRDSTTNVASYSWDLCSLVFLASTWQCDLFTCPSRHGKSFYNTVVLGFPYETVVTSIWRTSTCVWAIPPALYPSIIVRETLQKIATALPCMTKSCYYALLLSFCFLSLNPRHYPVTVFCLRRLNVAKRQSKLSTQTLSSRASESVRLSLDVGTL